MELVEKALAISLTGANPPSKEVMELVNDYIDGRKELEEIQKEVIARYKKEGESEWETLIF